MNGHAALSMMLRKLKLWVPLDADDDAALLGLPHNIATVPKGRTFIAEGDIVAHCWLVLSGFCVRYKMVGDGGRQIVSIHMKGDLVDLQNAIIGEADHSVQTLTACKMAKIPIGAIHELTNSRPTSRMRCGTIRSWTDRSIASGSPTLVGATPIPA